MYPSEEGDVEEVITKADAIRNQHAVAAGCNYFYDNDDDALQDLLCCPCTSTTTKPVGKVVTPYSV